MLHEDIVVVVGRTRPRSISLAMLTMKKELHGFYFCARRGSFPIVMVLCLADLWAPGASPQPQNDVMLFILSGL